MTGSKTAYEQLRPPYLPQEQIYKRVKSPRCGYPGDKLRNKAHEHKL